MPDNEKIAALAAALDGMKAERNWYRTAWTEAFREREELRVRLDSLKKSEDTTSAALAEALARNATLEQIKESQNRYIAMYREQLAGAAEEAVQSFSVDEMNWNRERDRLKWLAEGGMREVLDILSVPHPVNVSEAAAEHLERGLGTNMIWARQVVAQINAWWQAVLEQDEEFGL